MTIFHRLRIPLLPVTLLAGCHVPPAPAGSPAPAEVRAATDAGTEVPMLSQRGTVRLVTQDGRTLEVAVEIASNDPDRARGLMFRKTMPEMSGMIFVFPEERRQSFWMKNTYLPLDMLFIDAQGRVVGIVEYAEPLTLTPRGVDIPSQYVLEVNGGWCARNHVRAGDRMTLVGDYVLR